jgi:guanylate kinase
METLLELEEVNLRSNGISNLKSLENHPKLTTIDIESNLIEDVENIHFLKTCKLLRSLRLKKNAITTLPTSKWALLQTKSIPGSLSSVPTYRSATIFLVRDIMVLDGIVVTAEERVSCINCYSPPTDVVASLQHAIQLKKQAKNHARINAGDLIRSKRLRPIVLFGPNGAGKRTLIKRLIEQYPDIFAYTISHTTRKPKAGEENGVHYHFVSKDEMDLMIQDGKFIQAVTLFGNSYGTALDSIEKLTQEGKTSVMDLDFDVIIRLTKGVIALRKSHLKPRYIYITTPNMNVLEQRLKARQQDVKQWLEKATDQETLPYDICIVNDSLEEAYKQLHEYCLAVYWRDCEQEDGC